MTRIEQLEREINQKTAELNESLNIQTLLRETLKSNAKTMGQIKNQLELVESYLKYSNEYIHTLKEENLRLKSSCDEWAKRAIQLEFKVLNARDASKKQP
ncbi:MAG: hypothetical protein ACXWF8_03880 [Methylobacter sp.]